MTEAEKWQEASAAWQEVKSGKLMLKDFWAIVGDLCKSTK